MSVHYTLLPDAVGTLRADTKEEIFDHLVARLASVYAIDATLVREALSQREALGSTGFGRGFAIPHARVEGLKRPVAALLRLESAVEFDAVDRMPVDLVFGLLSPEAAGASHLQALAAVSRMMRDERMHQALLSAPDAEALYSLMCNVEDRDAA